jgi:hypothetical protein
MSLLSAFFGMDGANRMRGEAEQRAQQSQQLADQQQQKYYSDLMNYMSQAQAAQQGATSDYNTYKQQGTQRYADATQAMNGLLPMFAYAGGATGFGGANPYAPPMAANAGAGGTSGGNNRTPPNTGQGQPNSAAGTLNRNQRATSTQNSVKNPVQSAQDAANFDPYQLTESQQMQMNGAVDRINAQKQTAIENLRAQYAQHGITDPRAMQAGMQVIEEQFGGAAEQSKAQFLEQQRETKQKTYADMLNLFTQQQGQGQQQQLQGIQGGEGQINNLMQMAQNPALFNLMQNNQQNAMNNTQLAGQYLQQGNIGQSLLGAGMQGLGMYLGGYFNKPTAAAVPTLAPANDYPKIARMPDIMGR